MRTLALALLVALAGCAAAEDLARGAIDAVRTTNAAWDTDAADLRGQSGRYAFSCPANPSSTDRTHPVWGSGPYTDDSSVCRAAVHAGAISYSSGGRVVVEPRPGQSSYRGSTRNGVETMDYGSWDGSFVVVQ